MTFEYVCTRNDLADLLEIPHGKLTHVLYVAKVDSFLKYLRSLKNLGEQEKSVPRLEILSKSRKNFIAFFYTINNSCASKTIYALIFHTLSKKGKVSLRTARCIEISA